MAAADAAADAGPVEFYFEFASPYGYLASLQIDRLAARHGRDVVWRPIMLGAAFKRTGASPLMHTPLKGDYLLHDVPRCARLLKVPFVRPTTMPMSSLAASRAFWWLADRDAGVARRFARAVFHAHWGEGRDLGAPVSVAGFAPALGLDPDEMLAAMDDPAVKARLRAETEASLQRGVFGSPFIFVDGEPFWGADRMDQVELWLASGGW